MNAIGLDVGHSAVKVAAGDARIIFPTAAAPTVELSMQDAADRAKADTVRVGNRDYFVGHTALLHATSTLDGLRDDWIDTPEHAALLVSGYQRGIAALGDADPYLVIGLPSRLHGAQKGRLTEIATSRLGIDASRIAVVPQPFGAFMAMLLNEDGTIRAGRDPESERWGVIDVGYYTADFGLIEASTWAAKAAASGSGASAMAEAVRAVVEAKHGAQLPLRSCDAALRAGSVKLYGKVIDLRKEVDAVAADYAQVVIEGAIRAFGPGLSELDGIVLAGGGADLVQGHLRKVWPHTVAADSPRFTVADGMRRYGLLRQVEG